MLEIAVTYKCRQITVLIDRTRKYYVNETNRDVTVVEIAQAQVKWMLFPCYHDINQLLRSVPQVGQFPKADRASIHVLLIHLTNYGSRMSQTSKASKFNWKLSYVFIWRGIVQLEYGQAYTPSHVRRPRLLEILCVCVTDNLCNILFFFFFAFKIRSVIFGECGTDWLS